MWCRIFAASAVMPSLSAIRDFLSGRYASSSGEFSEDASGWYQANLRVDGVALQLERYLAEEPGIRAELNGWAAWLETRGDSPAHVALMERMIQTAQLFTLHAAAEEQAEEVCVALCRFLAETTAGVYQIDARGLFTADGCLLVAEEDERRHDTEV